MVDNFSFLINEAKALENELIALRRELHKIPEIGDNLPKTKRIVCEYLDKIGVAYRLLDDCDGVIAEINGARDGKTVAFRADMDALHIDERTDITFKSEIEGQMHGCGHDAHTALLLVAAKILSRHRDSLCGKVRFIFQTAEEKGTGANKMISAGAIDGVDAIFAIHVGNLAGDGLSAGDFAILPGFVSAAKTKFTITVRGKGTHSAFPDRGIDPILIAARIVNGCEELAARELPVGTPAVLSFGSFNAGEDHNTIPEVAVMRGSFRCHDAFVRDFLEKRVTEISEQIAKAYRGVALVEMRRGSDAVVNDEKMAAFVADTVSSLLGEDKVTRKLPMALMASDDFANYASRVPAVYFMLHTNNKEKGIVEANHNPYFDIDEDVLYEGVAAYSAIALRFLND